MIRLDDKVAIITGAARGQGAATARLFAEAGAQVILCDILDAEGHALAEEIGGVATYRRLDISSRQAWLDLVGEVEEAAGRIDVLINNAAAADSTPFLELDDAVLDRMIAVNLKGTLIGMQAVLPGMIDRGKGSIVNISSVNGLRGTGGTAAYDATKWAIRGMTKSVALEFADKGVRINSVHPGAIDTPMLNPTGGDLSGLARSFGLPMGRAGKPDEVAQASLFLASDAASYISGAELAVDGAWSAGIVLGRIADHRG